MQVRHRARFAVLALAAAATLPTFVRANEWNAPVSGTYSDPTNWDSSGVPDASGFAHFNTGSTAGYTVYVTANTNVDTFEVDDDTLTLNLGGHTFNTTASFPNPTSLVLGGFGSSSNLTITGGGTFVANQPVIGYSSGGTSSLTVDGSAFSAGFLTVSQGGTASATFKNNASLNLSGALLVGDAWEGSLGTFSASKTSITAQYVDVAYPGSSLSLSSASTLTSTGGTTINSGTSATVDGSTYNEAGSVVLDGSLTVQNHSVFSNTGGYVQVGSYTAPGQNPANLTVTGTGSQFKITGSNLPTLEVAFGADATVNVTAGAKLTVGRAVLGDTSDSTATVLVDGAGTSWANAADLYVGSSGNASLTISNGATMTASADGSTSLIAQNASSTGTVTIDGAGSKLSVTNNAGGGGLAIGAKGNGSITVKNGGALLTNLATLGSGSGSTGTATIDGANSTWTSQNNITVGSTGTGALTIKNGALVTAGGTVSLASGTAASKGTVNIQDAASKLTASALYIGGSSSTARGTGILNQSGGTTTISGTLKLWNTTNSAINLSGGTLKVGTLDMNSAPTTSRLNWTGGTLEINGSSPTVSATGNLPATLTINSNMALNIGGGFFFLTVANGAGKNLTVDGGTLTGDQNLQLGNNSAPGNLVIKNGGKASFQTVYMAIGSGSAGSSITVDGVGSKLTVTGNSPSSNLGVLGIAEDKNASLTIKNGGQVVDAEHDLSFSTSSATATVLVDGNGSKWTTTGAMVNGMAGTGNLTISNGALVSNAAAYLGGGPTAYSPPSTGNRTGTVTLIDTDGDANGLTTWSSTSSVYVGGSQSAARGKGIIDVQGGLMSVTGALKIYNTTGTLVSLSGGTLRTGSLDTSSTPAKFAWTGGTLTLTNSSLALDTPSTSAPLGKTLTLNSNQTLNITGAGRSLSINSGATLTNNGGTINAPITINAGGTLINTANMAVSMLDARAGSLLNSGTLTVSSGGEMKLGLQPVGGDIVIHGTLSATTTAGQSTTLTGNVSGEGAITGNVTFAGSYAPGNSPASVTLDNATFSSANTLTMELQGATTPGTDYDHITFTQSATLGGTLQLLLLNSFTPAAGQHFDLFDGTLNGTFSSLLLPSLSPNLVWDTSALYTTGEISVATATAPVPLPPAALAAAPLLTTLAYRRFRRPRTT